MAEIPEWLGKIIPADAVVGRDAFHVPDAPVVAGEELRPGEHVGFMEDGRVGVTDVDEDQYIGIVDPLLRRTVSEGQRFLLWLYPGTITGLRHVWHHPAFKVVAPVSQPTPVTAQTPATLPEFERVLEDG